MTFPKIEVHNNQDEITHVSVLPYQEGFCIHLETKEKWPEFQQLTHLGEECYKQVSVGPDLYGPHIKIYYTKERLYWNLLEQVDRYGVLLYYLPDFTEQELERSKYIYVNTRSSSE